MLSEFKFNMDTSNLLEISSGSAGVGLATKSNLMKFNLYKSIMNLNMWPLVVGLPKDGLVNVELELDEIALENGEIRTSDVPLSGLMQWLIDGQHVKFVWSRHILNSDYSLLSQLIWPNFCGMLT